MSQFFNVNLLNHDKNSDLLQQQNKICICCLAQSGRFIKLITCDHVNILQYLLQFNVSSNSLICSDCHHTLKKFQIFQQQVIENYNKLTEQLPLFKNKRINNLKKTVTEVYSNLEEEEFEIEETKHSPDYKIEVKIEEDSDFDIDIPLAQIKKKNKKAIKKKYKNKYEGKIKIVFLSQEELFEERERDARKESYLKLPYKCENCITGFDFELTLQDHLEKRHSDRKNGYKCGTCKSVLGTEASFKEHVKRHLRRYECEACGRRMNTLYAILKHYDEAHHKITNLLFTCKDCGFVTECNRKYRYHRDKHKAKPKCSRCGNTFTNAAGLKMHMFTVHKQSSRVYSCDACGKTYSSRSGLLAHADSAHRPPRDAYCGECGTHFRTRNILQHHLRTHSTHVLDGDKKFICDECGTRYLTKIALKEHIDWVHLKTTKYTCAICSKVFKNAVGLKRHSSFVHEKKRPPRNKICDHCGRGFTTLSILRAHVRTHTGARPLACAHCAATFAHPAARYTHVRTLHADAQCAPTHAPTHTAPLTCN